MKNTYINILQQYIDNHSNPETEFEKWFTKALNMLNKDFNEAWNLD